MASSGHSRRRILTLAMPHVLWTIIIASYFEASSRQLGLLLHKDNDLELNMPTMVNTPTSPHPHHTVIACISMGEYTRRLDVERILESIRKVGEFDGPVILVTDNPNKFNQTIQNDPAFFTFEPKSTHYKKSIRNKKLRYKRFKTKIIDILNDDLEAPLLDNVDTVIYLDTDIVVGQPLTTFISYARMELNWVNSENPGVSNMVLFREGVRPGEPFHTGAMILDRNHSQGCLQEWRQLMDENIRENIRETRDQILLGKLANNITSECHIEGVPQKPFLQFPTEKTMASAQPIGTLVHITHKRQYMIPHDLRRDFLQGALGLNITAM